jgi:hypothetical protein
MFQHGSLVVFPEGPATVEAAVTHLQASIDDGPSAALGATAVSDGAWIAVGADEDILTWVSAAQLGAGPRDSLLIARYGEHLRRRDAAAPVVVHCSVGQNAAPSGG